MRGPGGDETTRRAGRRRKILYLAPGAGAGAGTYSGGLHGVAGGGAHGAGSLAAKLTAGRSGGVAVVRSRRVSLASASSGTGEVADAYPHEAFQASVESRLFRCVVLLEVFVL